MQRIMKRKKSLTPKSTKTDAQGPKPIDYDVAKLNQYGAKKFRPLTSLKTLAVSWDNRLVYTSGYDVEHIIVLDLHRPRFVQNLKHHSDCVFTVSVDAGKRLLMSGGRDKRVVFWRVRVCERGLVQSHEFASEFRESPDFVMTVRIARNRNRAFALNQSSRVYEFETDKFRMLRWFPGFKYYFNDQYIALDWPAGSLFGASCSESQTFRRLRLSGLKTMAHFLDCRNMLHCFGVFNRRQLAVCGTYNGRLVLVGLKSFRLVADYQVCASESTVHAVAVSAKEDLVFAGTRNRLVVASRVGPVGKLIYLYKLDMKDFDVESLYLSPDDRKLTVGGGSSLRILSVADKLQNCL